MIKTSRFYNHTEVSIFVMRNHYTQLFDRYCILVGILYETSQCMYDSYLAFHVSDPQDTAEMENIGTTPGT